MNPQEKAQLQQYLEALVAAKGVNKLPEADQLIRQALSRQPDAAYLLVQRSMLLEQGLAQAKARIAELEEAQAPSRSFFGSGYQPNSGTQPPGSPAPYSPAAAGAPVYGGPAYGAPSAGSGAASFLGQAAATAAGVAGGAFLFEGLEHLFGHQRSGFGNESFIPTSNENVTVNNFYEGRDSGREDPVNDDDSVSDDDAPPDDDANFDDDAAPDSDSDWT